MPKRIVAGVLLLLTVFAIATPIHARKKKTVRRSSKAASATHKEKRSREAELAKLKRQIAEAERQLTEHTKKENLTKKQLAAREAKNKALKATLVRLKQEAAELESEQKDLDVSIKQTASSIDTLKHSYALEAERRYTGGLMRPAATKGSGFDDPNEETRRLRDSYYASLAATALHRNKTMLDSTKTVLSENREEVASLLGEQRGAINETSIEQRNAEQERARSAHELQDIRTRKQALQKELDRRKQAAKRLEGIIADLAAKEEAEIRRRKEAIRKREAERRNKRKSGRSLTSSERHQEELDRQEQKSMAGPHTLSWPTSSHRVVQGYGEQRNRELGTVTMNLGIDIGTASGSTVRAAADGKVALVSSLPSYGTLVIVRHGGGILTVYADLGSVSVSVGQSVLKGASLGRSGSNSELGEILHFEVWRGKSKQNPMGWLSR